MRKIKLTSITTVLLVLSILSLPYLAAAQEPCGTDVIHKELMAIDPIYKARVEAKEQKLQTYIKEAGSRRSTGTNDTIPVVVHVLHTGEAVGTGYNISDAQIQSSIDRANEVFADYDGSGTDSYIRFALAVRDPDGCTSSNGINRIDATGVQDYENIGMTADETRLDLFNLSRWNTEEYLNFWVVSEIGNNNGGNGTQGFATFSSVSHQYDGVVCMYNTTGYDPDGSIGYELKSDNNQNETIIHEFAHYLDVYHTFQGDDTDGDGATDSCPSDVDCGTNGDCCGDTDVHQRTYSNVCWNNNTNSCTGNNYGDVVKNYMAYSSQDCKDHFTDDQVARMQAILTTGRTGLMTSPGLTSITATEPTSACDAITSSTGTSGNYGMGITKITLGSSAVEVSSNDLEIDFADGGIAPDGDLVVYLIEDQPADANGESYEATRHWVVRNFGNNQSGLNIESITMTLPLSDPLLVYGAADMTLNKRASGSDGDWTEVASTATTVTPASGKVFFGTLTGFTSFSQLLAGGTGTSLPVELIEFSAKRTDSRTIQLDWSTASEINNKGFEILKSYDGTSFEKVDFVAGEGTTSSVRVYQMEVKESEDAYYQLRQVDWDGESALSPIRFVEGSKARDHFTLFPNPTGGSFQLFSDGNISEKVDFRILDVNGNRLLEMTGDLSGINTALSQEVNTYPSGIYFILINDGMKQYTKRLVIDKL